MASTTVQGNAAAPPLWHVAYPAPKIVTPPITREMVLEMLRDGSKVASKDFILIDLRRVDYEVYVVCRYLD